VAPPQPTLKGRALRHLSAREHSRVELARKLAPHTEDPDELERVLDELEARGFLSDARFVESVVHRRASRLGAARVKQELLAKGIAGEQVRAAVLQLQASEFDRAVAVWRQRFGAPATDAREHARQVRFLLARGFAADVVRRVVKTASGPDDAA
jgi:regulatory protein